MENNYNVLHWMSQAEYLCVQKELQRLQDEIQNKNIQMTLLQSQLTTMTLEFQQYREKVNSQCIIITRFIDIQKEELQTINNQYANLEKSVSTLQLLKSNLDLLIRTFPQNSPICRPLITELAIGMTDDVIIKEFGICEKTIQRRKHKQSNVNNPLFQKYTCNVM
jgi:hypothetical protein